MKFLKMINSIQLLSSEWYSGKAYSVKVFGLNPSFADVISEISHFYVVM